MLKVRKMMQKLKQALSFDDVLLEPQRSDIESRSEVDITSCISDTEFSLPVISSPMDTVTGSEMATSMWMAGGFGVLHRYNSIPDQVRLVMKTRAKTPYVAAAIGVTGDYIERAAALVGAGASLLCIDVAHGHHTNVERAIKSLKDRFEETISIMAGNVATEDAFEELQDWGADSIRVGVGGGSICSTRIQTAHGIPTFQSVLDCGKVANHAKIIADGGIRNAGDVVKSLAAGADFVMLGSMLAGTSESPGEVFQSTDGNKYKVYRGMASVEAQVDWRGRASSLEGVSTTIPYKGSVDQILSDLARNVRSGFSYTGARSVKEFRNKVKMIRQTQAGMRESFTHILLK